MSKVKTLHTISTEEARDLILADMVNRLKKATSGLVIHKCFSDFECSEEWPDRLEFFKDDGGKVLISLNLDWFDFMRLAFWIELASYSIDHFRNLKKVKLANLYGGKAPEWCGDFDWLYDGWGNPLIAKLWPELVGKNLFESPIFNEAREIFANEMKTNSKTKGGAK